MKPQSLQDAIKAQALARAKKREKGEWKEPVVKQHKITAEDMSRASPRVQSPAAVTPVYASASPPMYASAAAPTMNNADVTAIKNLMQAKLLPLVEGLSAELKQQKSAISTLQEESADLSNSLERQRSTITSLKKENQELKEMIKQQSASILSALREENNELKALLKDQGKKAEKMVLSSAPPVTPATVSKPSVKVPMSPFYSSPPPSPSKKVKPPASLEPHGAEDLLANQRKDTALRHFMKTKEGLFDPKYMSLREVDGGNLVLFKKKIYIPEKLRTKTIEYYRSQHSESEALEKMRKNWCWPDMEKGFFAAPSY